MSNLGEMLRLRYKHVINKPGLSMKKDTGSSKALLMIATMLPAIMLAASLTLSLVPATRAFAQEDNTDSNNQTDIHNNEGGDGSVIVDPIVQPSVDVKLNVDVNTHVITDPERCDEASDEVSQANNQGSTEEARSDGNVGDNSVYVSPQVQSTTLVGANVYVDTDVVPEGCNPNDTVNQANDQSSSQDAGGDVEAGRNSIINIPTVQSANTVSQNDNVNTDATLPVSLPQ
jgi:hypothetical protein